MLQTENLNKIWLTLSSNSSLKKKVHGELERLFQEPTYQGWWKTEPRTPFELSLPDLFPTLKHVGFIDGARLLVKVNQIGFRLFVTDGAWVQSPMRVFPDPDEALVLLKHVEKKGLHTWADWVIDPAAGCGHTPLGFQGSAKRIFCDANARALTFASLNALINDLASEHCFGLLNDMNRKFPTPLRLQGKTLFLTNVPFAPAPDDSSLALNSGGGEHGADLQIASFELVKKFSEQNSVPVRACFLTWTLGNATSNEWEVPRLCQDIFPTAKIQWTLEQHDYDAPDLPNPAPLRSMLRHLARSQYVVKHENKNVEEAYENLADKLQAQGFTHIAYGFLDCEL
ncbi:hypothetical protein AZI87_01820 [Bdellovibrio bacteriovorus]|uniref:Uncharacterized protein n=1 Tax=Bdellovibrio bacteriovorus TaxID=959 RepID=A0A162GFN1_BDEBC|nr:hypothetical protein [Bdellovibrio bacteriovorus]KYG68032.1 hypothetical protein AZI87_01820 [Bdellovibrio bacteriovorus]